MFYSLDHLSATRRHVAKLAFILLVFMFLVAAAVAAENASLNIKVDQVGYLPSAQKIALVSAPAQTFQVKRTSDGKTVLEGKVSAAVKDADTGDSVQAADFSELRAPGKYYLEVPGVGRSWNFSIGPDVFSRAYYLAMRAFYGQRCGTAVDLGPEFPGYKYGACHLKGEFHPSSGKQGERDNIGGWHDAGDYGRYVVNSGITTGTLLWTWEIFSPNVKNIKLNIPESGNGTPDILNEARWNIEWMLKMQDDDGGAWHKQTTTHFSGFIMPDDDHELSEVIGTGKEPFKGTCATADLAGVAAIAARVYQPFDAKFAARNLEAARKAWLWTEKYPNVTFTNPPGVQSGWYADNDCSDERLWAAAELWRTTGDTVYGDYFLKNYADHLQDLAPAKLKAWNNLGPMAVWTYALAKRKGDATAIAEIRKASTAAAHDIVDRSRNNGYRVSLRSQDYVWGSNGGAANYGVQLLVTNLLSPDPAFVEAARDNLHYLLGRNTFSLSWVTSVGENAYRHPHHRPSGAGKTPGAWPGMLSGGPDKDREDKLLKALPELPPAKLYLDDQESYASNEICINWQAALVFLLAEQLP